MTEHEGNVPIGGDFARIFDGKDYLAMLNTPDEAACVLRGHLVLEEFINLWVNKITSIDDFFGNVFVPFKTKLALARNSGLDEEIFKALDKVNDIRNRFGHRRGYELEQQTLDSLRARVNKLECAENIRNCEDFSLYRSGLDQNGQRRQITENYEESDNRLRFVIIFVVLMMKLAWWMQNAFQRRGIRYTIIARLDG